MPYIDWKKLKERVSLRDILDHYGLAEGLTETPHGFEGECPFCESRAFKANTEKNAWFCFGECRAKAKETDGHSGGNILDFVARMEDVSVKKAAALIAEWFLEYPESSAPRATRSSSPTQRKNAHAEEAEKRLKMERETVAPRRFESKETVPEPVESKDVLEVESEGQGRAMPAMPSGAEDLTGRTNPPLAFILQSITLDHPALHRLGFERETLAHFGVGYFTGKGMMHEKVVIPFHDKESRLVAYVGYSVEDGSLTYPKDFDQRLELYNYPLCEFGLGLDHSGVVLVTDILNVFRLYELGVRHVLALPSEEIHTPQLDLIESLVGLGGGVEFVPWTKHYSENLQRLSERFHTRLHRYYLGSEEEFVAQVVETLDW
ncbi:hypothetical protein THIOKS13320013 [Thiocapsa sp. KS1]|nr:hypothetical protein [Thiocapsa sp. KS1]CRI66941.1 hypothetical protein THIOKS13320013 [Thiocapsa sp. KS1]